MTSMTTPATSAVSSNSDSMANPDEPVRGGRPRSPAADHALIRATLETLEEDGYAGLSMAGVAKRAGVSATTLYRRWSCKADMVAAAVATLSPVVDRPDTGTLAQDLRLVLRGRAKALRSDEGKLLLGLLAEIVKHPDMYVAVKQRLTESNLNVLADLVERAVGRGEIPAIDLHLALDFIAGPFWSKLLAGNAPTDHFVDDVVPMLVAALKAAPTPRTRRRQLAPTDPSVGRRPDATQ
jgi:AcrR family transcriptional regulator